MNHFCDDCTHWDRGLLNYIHSYVHFKFVKFWLIGVHFVSFPGIDDQSFICIMMKFSLLYEIWWTKVVRTVGGCYKAFTTVDDEVGLFGHDELGAFLFFGHALLLGVICKTVGQHILRDMGA